MQVLRIKPGGCLQGNLPIPGDKSITHRALIIGAIMHAGCEIVVNNWLPSLDCKATLNALQAMGVNITSRGDQSLQIASVGLHGLQAPAKILHVGNSGTTIRLLTGILAAQKFSSTITGDSSICKRPMRRIIAPLTQMGAQISAIKDDCAPLIITGGRTLHAINYTMPMASAQVKSAILLVSLYTQGTSRVTTPSQCRDHTEIMLDFFARLPSGAKKITLDIPGDLSAAAFFMVGATIAAGSDLTMQNIGINPTRTAVIDLLRSMGADISITNSRVLQGELRADLRVRHVKKLCAVEVPQELVANAIDEIPALCLAAACAQGTTIIRGAQELRYKESDRIAMLAHGLTSLGIEVSVFSDGLAITGGVISGGVVASGGDHRIAMTFTMAGLVAQQQIIVQDTAIIATSFPGFVAAATGVGMLIVEESLCPI